MITDDFIRSIDKIYNIDISKPYYEYDLNDPIAGIFTPEWYYSYSYRIFSNQTITWEQIEKPEIIKKMALTI